MVSVLLVPVALLTTVPPVPVKLPTSRLFPFRSSVPPVFTVSVPLPTCVVPVPICKVPALTDVPPV